MSSILIIHFNNYVLFHCMNATLFIMPPVESYSQVLHKLLWNGHPLHMCLCAHECEFPCSGGLEGNHEVLVYVHLQLYKVLSNCSPRWLNSFTLFTLLPTLDWLKFLHFNQFDVCEKQELF